MEDQLTCNNGHIYESSYDKCPYCPGEGTDATVVEGSTDDNSNATERTEIMDNKIDKTAIHQAGDDKQEPQSGGRKLVGWLVSFTWNAQGEDYQLREGKTTLGADKSSDICVNDPEVSAHHCTLLYRSGKFQIKDEFSTNGLKVNDKDIDDRADLNDGDTLKIGKTEFKFRTT